MKIHRNLTSSVSPKIRVKDKTITFQSIAIASIYISLPWLPIRGIMSSKKLIETSNSGGDGDYGSLRPQDLEERSSSERLQRRRSSLAELGDSLASIGTSMRNGLRGSLVFSGSNCSIRELGGNSTISKSTFNLIKNLVGAGVLSLPSGVCVTIPVIAASLLLLVDVLINLFSFPVL